MWFPRINIGAFFNKAATIALLIFMAGNAKLSGHPYMIAPNYPTDTVWEPLIKNDSLKIQKPERIWLTGGVTIAGFSTSMLVLDKLWYEGYPRTNFHFKDDWGEWYHLDKLGHSTTSYHLGRMGYQAWKWAGVREPVAVWLGGSMGSLFLTTVEILDGFSAQWGASPSDLGANTLGSALFISQQLLWNEQKILLKMSSRPSPLAQYRPSLLGKNYSERLLKDYNGLTFWLSCPVSNVFKECPEWLAFSVGYGADGMLGAYQNPSIVGDVVMPSMQRTRSFYLSADICYSKIHSQSDFLNQLFFVMDFIKCPAPALEINSRGQIIWHWVFF